MVLMVLQFHFGPRHQRGKLYKVQQQDCLVQWLPTFTPHGAPIITLYFPTDHFFLRIKERCLKTTGHEVCRHCSIV